MAVCILIVNGAVPDFRGVRFPLWPTCFPVYASCGSFGSIALSIRNLQNIIDSPADLVTLHPVHLVPGIHLTGVSLFVSLNLLPNHATLGMGGWLSLTQ